jgi:23S rRNA (cytosine1962-C5)-methyltransferase
MLHVAAATLSHPEDGRRITIESPVPAALERWLRSDCQRRFDGTELKEAVEAAAHLRFGLAHATDTNAFRLIHGAGDQLPGLSVDCYGDHLVVALAGDAAAQRGIILDALEPWAPQGIYLKLPPKQASTLTEARRAELAPPEPVWGRPAPAPLGIVESGLPFEVYLGDGLATGIFLDQRDNRVRVRQLAAGARVLNLFGYAGAFTVAAIAGGAAATVTVDAARAALARAERAIGAVSDDLGAHQLVCEDALDWLRRAARRGELFDLVVLDPPRFATTKRSRFRAATDYRSLAARALRCVAPGGRLLACTNHRGITVRKLRQALRDGAADADRQLLAVESLPPPIDFPPDPERGPHLKTLLAEVGPK